MAVKEQRRGNWQVQIRWHAETIAVYGKRRKNMPPAETWLKANTYNGLNPIENRFSTVEAAVEVWKSHSWHPGLDARIYNLKTREAIPCDIFAST